MQPLPNEASLSGDAIGANVNAKEGERQGIIQKWTKRETIRNKKNRRTPGGGRVLTVSRIRTTIHKMMATQATIINAKGGRLPCQKRFSIVENKQHQNIIKKIK